MNYRLGARTGSGAGNRNNARRFWGCSDRGWDDVEVMKASPMTEWTLKSVEWKTE